MEVLRSRQSLLAATPRKVRSSQNVLEAHIAAAPDGRGGGPESEMTTASDSPVAPEQSGEREQRLMYLRQAFCGFFKAKQGVEMQNLARVMCAILGVSPEEQATILESIDRMGPALVATTTLESLSYNFSSLFT